MIINHNLNAMNAHRQMGINIGNAGKATEKLSSGLRINRAGDDAAGLAISEKMRGQIRGLNQASRNAQDGISLIQTAEGALNETHAILHRMKELTVQAANDTNVSVDKANLQLEIEELKNEINRIASQTQFNTQTLLNGSLAKGKKSLTLQIGANAKQIISLNIGTMTTKGLKLDKLSIGGSKKAASISSQLKTIDDALDIVSKERAKLGANQNRLEHTIANVNNASENLQAAESRVRDVDMAKEMMNFSKNNILQQAAQAMLAQANQAPQGILQLLR
ncbi:flagellin [Clostridium tetani]|uniref:flagellin N-terminal helical domain-containing protein n=1 Tax=Clostridium tetani TaxID=1513 RepID=UPI00100BF95E|nr:flagellin [Clostridium tetani]RXI45888.1 flagellin [Clostridium tetani]RXM61280.1 flagellin [Clostridium tetani]RXM70105.1 flagellin [Clostridium tetani]